ncbi:hypothetical protein Aperf_G00000056848 [Anoplocephala perfoliata]
MCTVPEDLAAVVSTSAAISSHSSVSSPVTSHSSLLPGSIYQPANRRKRRRAVEIPSTTTAAAVTSPSAPNSTASQSAMRETGSSNPVPLIDADSTPITTSNTSTLQSATSAIVSNADSTLLRKLLGGADLATVRNHSVLVDSNFSLRRTSSMSTTSSRYKAACTSDSNSEDKRRRRSTMYSQRIQPRKGSDHEDDLDPRPCKRPKESIGIDNSTKNGNSSPLLPIKVESRDPEETPSYTTSANNLSTGNLSNSNDTLTDTTEKSMSKFPGKPSTRWRLKSPSHQSPSHSLSPPAGASTSRADLTESSPMRPRARTTSELDIIRMFTAAKCPLDRFRLDNLDPLKVGKLGALASHKSDLRRGDAGDKSSDITSPLSQLLESTPPYSSSGTNTIHPRANTTTSVYPWSMDKPLKSSNPSITRLGLSFPGNGCKHYQPPLHRQHQQHHHQPTSTDHHLEMLNLTKSNPPASVAAVPTDAVASILAASSRFLQGIREEQVLNFSQKDVVSVSRQLPPPPPPNPLPISSLTTDDILHWSPCQLAALQQLFCLSDASNAAGVNQTMPPRPAVTSVSDSQAGKLPIRLASGNRLTFCQRVAEWMLVANNWTMQMCPAPIMPENSLLATAATYRYCRCSEAELAMSHPIDNRLEMPRLGPGLRAVLHRIWPQLLLVSMIRENFSFTTAPIPAAELTGLLGNSATSREGSGADLNIAKAGTANALKNLITAGNQLLLDTQIFECVKKCIFAQHAYPDFYPVSYASAIEELRQCCHRCSGDLSLFNSVVLLMNEMQAINPEGLHCLFSLDRLSGLFVPPSDAPSLSSVS